MLNTALMHISNLLVLFSLRGLFSRRVISYLIQFLDMQNLIRPCRSYPSHCPLLTASLQLLGEAESKSRQLVNLNVARLRQTTILELNPCS